MAADAPTSGRGRAGRLLAGCITVGGGVVALVLAVTAGFYTYLRTEAGNVWIKNRVEGVLEGLTPYGEVTIGRVDTNVWNRVALYDLRIVDEEGDTLIFVERVLMEMQLGRLSRRTIRLPALRLDGVLVDLEMREDGVLDIARVFGQEEPTPPDAPEEPFEGLPVTLDLPDVVINGAHVRYRDDGDEVIRAVGIDAVASIQGREVVEISDVTLTGLLAEPGPSAVRADGSVTYSADGWALSDVVVTLPHSQVTAEGTIADTFDVDLGVRRLNFPTVDPLIGEPGLIGTYAGELQVTGPTEALEIEGSLRGVGDTVGRLTADITLHTEEDPFRISGPLTVDDFHVHHLVPQVDEPVILNGSGDLELLVGDWPEELVVDLRYQGGRQEAYGQVVESLAGHFRIEDGILTLRDTTARGIIGDIAASGTIDLVDGPMRLDVTGTAEPAYLRELGIEGLETTAFLDVVVRGNVMEVDTVPITVDGTATWRPFRYEDMAAFDRLTARFDARVQGGELVTGTARVDATGGEASGVLVDDLVATDVRFRVPLDDGTITVQGNVDGSGVRYPDVFDITSAVGVFDVQIPPDGDPIVNTRLDIGAHTLLDFPGTSGEVVATVAGDDVTYRVELQQDARDMLVADGSFDLATDQVVLDELMLAPTPRASWTNLRQVRFRVTDGGVADADIALTGNLGTLQILGTLGTEGPLDGSVAALDLQLDTFAELFPDQVSGLSGELDLEATLAGTARSPQIEGSLAVEGLWIEDTVRWLDAAGSFTADRTTFSPQLWLAVAGDPLAVVWGDIPVSLDLSDPQLATSREVDLAIALRPGSLRRLELVSPALEPDSLPVGEASAVVEATGPLGDPDFRFAGVAELEVENWLRPARIEFDVRRDASDLAFWADLREGFQQRANLSGTGETRMGEVFAWAFGEAPEPDLEDYELWLNDMMLNAVLIGMPASQLAAAAGADLELGGELVGGVSITGSPYTPRVEGGLHWLEGRIGDVELEGAYALVTPTEDAYQVDAAVDFLGEGGITAAGEIPVRIDLREDVATWTAGDLDLTIGGPGIPLEVASAFEPGIDEAEGLLVIRGTVGGPFGDPRPDLEATLVDGSLIYNPLGLRFFDIDMRLTADDRMIRLPQLHMRTEPTRPTLAGGFEDLGERQASVITAVGSTQLDDWNPTALSARIQFENDAWVSASNDVILRVEGGLQASGTWPELAVNGRLELSRGLAEIDTASFVEAAPLEVDPNLVIDREGARPPTPEPDEPAFYENFDVNVTLDANRNLFLELAIPWIEELGALGASVTRADITSRLGGEVELELRQGEPTLVGEIEVIEGRVRVLRSQLDLEEGSIVFAGGDPSNPNLDLHASMDLTEGSVDMYIRGTVEEPDIEFASDEYDETQILVILLTGRAPDALTEDQAQGAAEALAGLLLNSLFAGPAVGALTIEPDGAVSVGLPVSSNLYTTTRVAPYAGIDENQLSFAIEWAISRRLVLEAGVGDTTSWADLFWEIRF